MQQIVFYQSGIGTEKNPWSEYVEGSIALFGYFIDRLTPHFRRHWIFFGWVRILSHYFASLTRVVVVNSGKSRGSICFHCPVRISILYCNRSG